MGGDELAVRAARGDRDAFTELFERHEGMLRQLIRIWIPSDADGDDVYQQILIAAWRDLPSLRESSRISYWLRTLVRRRCLNFLRARRRGEVRSTIQSVDNWSARYGLARHRELATTESVRDAIAAVPTVHREILEEHYLMGRSVRDIAAQRSTPEGTVKRQLMEGRQYVRAELGVTPAIRIIKEEPMTKPRKLDEVLERMCAELAANGKAQYAALLDRENVVAGIETALEDYDRFCQPRARTYVRDVLTPLIHSITEGEEWPEGVELEYFCEIKSPNRPLFNGFSVGLEIRTPNAEFPGFSLPVVDVWYGRWLDDE